MNSLFAEMEALTMPTTGNYTPAFEMLWSEYRPIKAMNCSKFAAFKAYDRLSKEEQSLCLRGVMEYVDWLIEERRKKPDYPACHLSTYINQRRWED
jgi:hypothetical protein